MNQNRQSSNKISNCSLCMEDRVTIKNNKKYFSWNKSIAATKGLEEEKMTIMENVLTWKGKKKPKEQKLRFKIEHTAGELVKTEGKEQNGIYVITATTLGWLKEHQQI